MVIRLKIILDHPTATVLTGSEVSGTVVVQTREPKKYKSIKIFLKGNGQVTVRSRDSASAESYVNLEKVLWSKSQSPDPDCVLPAGEHCFPFQFILPSSLPSSFEGNQMNAARCFGALSENDQWIRYYLKAQILSKSVFNHTITVPLQVTEVIDINTAGLNRPVQLVKQKTVGCLWWTSGPITASVEVPRAGYCAGEAIPFRVTVENGSNRRIECVARLQQYCLFERSTQKRNNHHCGQTLRSQSIEPHITRAWESSMTIPTHTPVSVNTAIVKRLLNLKIVVDIPNALNLVICLPVTVGNVPYRHEAPYATHATSELTSTEPPSYRDAITMY